MNIKKYIGLALLPMVFTACQEDTLVNDQAQGIYTLKATVDKAAPMSRAQVVLGGTSTTTETFHWNAGDALTIFDFNDASNVLEHTFTIDSEYDGQSASAEFGTDNALMVGKNYFAYYGSYVPIQTSFLKLYSASSQLADNSENSWIKYFSNNMYMISTGTVSEDMGIEMKHLCSLLRVTYTNATDEDVEISSVKIGGYICMGHAYDVTDISNPGYAFTNNPGISFINPVTVKSGDSEEFYILVFAYSKDYDSDFTGLKSLNIESVDGNVLTTPSMYKGEEFAITEFKAGAAYWFNITQTADGLVWTNDANQGEEEDVTVTFTNKSLSLALYNVLGEGMVTLNEDSCAVMNQADVNSVTRLDFYQRGLTSLEGLEEFVNLESFVAGDCYLSGSIKVTNSSLREFDVYNNDITSLDVSGLTQLEKLVCSENSSLGNNINIEGTNLKDLQFHHTGASSLDFIPQNLIAQIENFDCGGNGFTSMDLSAYTSVKNIWISVNGLTSLVLPKTETLEILDMTYNPGITSVDLTIYPNLKEFYNQQNNLESIDVSKCPELYLLFTNGNKLTELDLTNNPKITNLYCDGQQEDRVLTLYLPEALMDRWNNEWKDSFTNVVLGNGSSEEVSTITIENAELAVALQAVLGVDKVSIDSMGYAVMTEEDVLAVTDLDFGWEGIYTVTSLRGIEHFVNLRTLYCNYSGLKECNLKSNTKLMNVVLCGSELTTLDVSGLTELEYVACGYSDTLNELIMTDCNKLGHLECMDTQLTELNFSNPDAVWQLICNLNPNLKVDLTLYPNLTTLGMNHMGLTSLNIPENLKTQLVWLSVSSNQLTSLNLSEYPNLEYLQCNGNHMTALDITPLTKLKMLSCGGQTVNGIEGGDLTLELTLTDAQKTLWETDWVVNDSLGNGNVELNVVSTAGGGISWAE